MNRLLFFLSRFWVRNLLAFMMFASLITIVALREDSLRNKASELFTTLLALLAAFVLMIFHNRVLLEKFFLKKRLSAYLTGVVFIVTLFYLLNKFTPVSFNSNGDSVNILASTFLIVFVGMGLYLLMRLIKKEMSKPYLALEQKTSELNYLKAQLNPHFLFNALNSLYASALETPHETPERIQNLSALLRYQIQASQRQTVTLGEELKFIEEYLAYEKVKNQRLKIRTSLAINNVNAKVAPLILMPFLENAVKFSQAACLPFIDFTVSSTEYQLEVEIRNTFNPGATKNGTRLGLKNVAERLNILYPERHSLKLSQTLDHYSIYLRITW